jgi:type I restriction enzyme, S subunit
MKSKPEPFTGYVAEEDQPHSIPATWLWVEIGSLSDVVGGGTPSTTKGNYFEGGTIPWLTPADMSGYSEMYISGGRRNITEAGLQNSSARLLPKDSLLFSSRAPIGYVAIAQNTITTNQGFKSFFPTEAYLPHYGYWYLKSIKALAESMASGTTFLELSGSKAAKLPFPIAPLAEQRRIVVQLDAAMQQVEASQARLEKLPGLLKQFRQAVLAAAVSGRLTEAWRAEHPQQETGADLLARIRAERRAQWEEKQLAKIKGKQLSLNDNWKQKYEEPAEPDTSEMPDLPEGWVYATFEQISDRVTVGFVGSMKDEYVEEGIPFLRSQNVRENRFNPEGLIYISPEFHERIRKSTLEPGDLVVVRSGSVGTACVIPETLPEANCSDLVIVKQPKVLPQLCGYYMNSAAKAQVSNNTVGMALSHFNTRSMAKMPLPVPAFEEQREIVRQVTHYFALADALEARFEQAAAIVEQLPQALLAKAFCGQLVPQDPNDEPASDLLERLRNTPAPAKIKRERAPKFTYKKDTAVPQPLLDILTQHPDGISPEKLFSLAGFTEADIDTFYQELATLRPHLVEDKPTGEAAKTWPKKSSALRLKPEHHAD